MSELSYEMRLEGFSENETTCPSFHIGYIPKCRASTDRNRSQYTTNYPQCASRTLREYHWLLRMASCFLLLPSRSEHADYKRAAPTHLPTNSKQRGAIGVLSSGLWEVKRERSPCWFRPLRQAAGPGSAEFSRLISHDKNE